jgi:hypothetical protein
VRRRRLHVHGHRRRRVARREMRCDASEGGTVTETTMPALILPRSEEDRSRGAGAAQAQRVYK